MKRVALSLLFGYLAAAACAQPVGTFSGRVVAALDGDSMRLLRDGREVEVRLHGVDAPEGGQAHGDESRQFLSTLVRGRTVVVDVRDVDQYERLVARVGVDGKDVGLEVIRAGQGWYYTRYSKDEAYATAERDARQARRGLWADPAPLAPWVFRDQHGPRGRPDAPGTSPGREPRSEAASPAAAGPFHGNVKSRVFHAPGCEHYRCKECTAVFASYDAAVAAGYRPHKECAGR